MPLKTYRFQIPPELAGARLDEALGRLLERDNPVSKSQVRKLIVAGAVYLNRRRVRIASKSVIVGAHIEVHIDWSRLQTGAQAADLGDSWSMSSSAILYEDAWLIVVDKPPGIPTQPTIDEARANLYAAVSGFLKKRDSNPQAYLGLHHRLDRDTSGVLLFTKSREANRGVSEMFSKHLIQKEYRALVTGPWAEKPVGDRWEIQNYLKRAPGKKSFFQSVHAGGDWAHTCFDGPQDYEVQCWPRTGRTHQIRVHLSEAGLPIIGDPLYEARWIEKIRRGFPNRFNPEIIRSRLMLHAACLTFVHPISRKEVTINSPIPKDFQLCKARLLANI